MEKNVLSSTLLSIIFLIICASIISCSKNDSPIPKPIPTYTPVGLWVGTYTHDQDPSKGDQYIAFNFKADSTIIINGVNEDYQSISIGTWILIKDSLAINTTTIYAPGTNNVGTMQLFSAKFDTLSRSITNGHWGDYKPIIGSGTFKATFSN